MSKILVVDNELPDVDGLLGLIRDIQSESRGPDQVLTHKNCGIDGLAELYSAQISGTPYDAIITDFHLGVPSKPDMDGDELLFAINGNLGEVLNYNEENFHPTSFEDISQIPGIKQDTLYALTEIFESVENYHAFVEAMAQNPPTTIIFSGSYEGRFPVESVDGYIQKQAKSGTCEKAVVEILSEERILDPVATQHYVNDINNADKYFFGVINGTNTALTNIAQTNSYEEIDPFDQMDLEEAQANYQSGYHGLSDGFLDG